MYKVSIPLCFWPQLLTGLSYRSDSILDRMLRISSETELMCTLLTYSQYSLLSMWLDFATVSNFAPELERNEGNSCKSASQFNFIGESDLSIGGWEGWNPSAAQSSQKILKKNLCTGRKEVCPAHKIPCRSRFQNFQLKWMAIRNFFFSKVLSFWSTAKNSRCPQVKFHQSSTFFELAQTIHMALHYDDTFRLSRMVLTESHEPK